MSNRGPFTAFRPMLAGTVDNVKEIPWPMFASPKIDGLRCTIHDGQAWSRSGKLIRNVHVQKTLSAHADVLEGMDGELLVGKPTDHGVFHKSSSKLMSIQCIPDFSFHIFDSILNPEQAFADRYQYLLSMQDKLPPFALLITQTTVHNPEEVLDYEAGVLAEGYEGVMLRHPFSPYKNARSTRKEAYLLKLKRFTDAEAVCIGYGELMHNTNEGFKNELGFTERSAAQAGMLPGNTLGYLLCENADGIQFKIGTGFTQAQRDSLWLRKEWLVGQIVKYKFFNIGVKEAPRHPVWLGFRDEDDMSDEQLILLKRLKSTDNTWLHTLNSTEQA